MSKKWEPRQYEKFIQIRHSSLILYTLSTDNYSHRRKEFSTPTYQGKITSGSGKRIRKTVDLLLQISKKVIVWNPILEKKVPHTLSFITLTIPEQERKPEAQEGYKYLLGPWLLKMKRKARLNTYVWKAEFQKNGMLHYHITTPSWIHYQLIKDEWNNLLSTNNLLNEHFKNHRGQFPNSTDIHEVYKSKDLNHYLQKEISKNHQEKKTTGKVWDCSMNLKKNKHYTTIEPSNFQAPAGSAKIKVLEHCTILSLKNPSSILPDTIKAEYKAYIRTIQEHSSQ